MRQIYVVESDENGRGLTMKAHELTISKFYIFLYTTLRDITYFIKCEKSLHPSSMYLCLCCEFTFMLYYFSDFKMVQRQFFAFIFGFYCISLECEYICARTVKHKSKCSRMSFSLNDANTCILNRLKSG